MFKRISIVILAAGLIVAVSAGAFSALAAPQENVIQAAPVALDPVNTSSDQAAILVQAAGDALTSDESAGLLFMYEEEQLARDVYTALYDLWGQPVFQNIASSEQTHMNAIGTLLVRYGISVPASTAGVFNDPELQALYNDLMDMGSLSMLDALKVGATVEEVDILDLQERLTQTSNADIQQVYNSLLNGSYNHLRSFTSLIERLGGETYQPQYLTLEQYQTILSGTTGRAGVASGSSFSSGNAGSSSNGRGFRGGR